MKGGINMKDKLTAFIETLEKENQERKDKVSENPDGPFSEYYKNHYFFTEDLIKRMKEL